MKSRTLTLIANEVRGLFNASAEPTLEVLTGKDSFNQSLAAGAQAADLLDGDRDGRLTVNTNGVPTVFHLDTALDRRLRVDRVILDNHTLRKAYGDDVGNLVKVLYNSTDNYGTATEAAIARVQSRLLARGPAYLNFNGINDKVVTGTDGNLAYDDTTPFSLGVIFRSTDTSDPVVLMALWQSASPSGDDVIALQLNAGQVEFVISKDWATKYIRVLTDDMFNDGEWHFALATYDGSGLNTGMEIKIDGVLVDVTRAGAGDVTGFTATNTLGMANSVKWYASNFYKGDIGLGRLWNRELSTAEALVLYGYWTHTPIPIADQWGSQTALITGDDSDMDTVGNWLSAGGGVVTGGYNSGDAGHETTLRIEGDGTYSEAVLFDQFTLKVGKKFRERFNYKHVDATGCSHTDVRVKTGDDNQNLKNATISATWADYEDEFVSTYGGATCDLRIQCDDGNGDPANEMLIDNETLVQIGCVAEYRPEGIGPTHGKWHDHSSNNLHGTIAGAEARYVPIGDEGEMLLIELEDEIDARYLYLKINPDGLTGDANTFFGQMLMGRAAVLTGVKEFDEESDYPGIDVSKAYGGSELPSVRYEGQRREWPLHLVAQNDDFRDGIYRAYLAAKGAKKVPLYLMEDITWNDGRPERLIYCVKFDAPLRRKRTGKYHEIETALREVAGT